MTYRSDSSSSPIEPAASVQTEQPRSSRLQIVAAYFGLSGLLGLGASAYYATHFVLGKGSPTDFGPRPLLGIAFLLSAGVSWLLTGVALFRRQRFGLLMALVALCSSAGVGFFGGPPSLRDVAFFGVSVILLASIWRELE